MTDLQEHAPAVNTVEIDIFGHPVKCPDLPEYRKFYRKLGAGAWEPHTFAALAGNLDKATVYIDIGGWIGVTAFWASRLAKRVVVVEPDPKCREILTRLAPCYPNVTIVEGALSTDPAVRLNAVEGFGSSESSALDIGDGASLTVPGLTIADLLAHAGADPVFVKIDIEGYEFRIIREIAKLTDDRVRGLQCALHPGLYERSLAGPWLWRRLRTLAATLRFAAMFAGRFDGPFVVGFPSFAAYLVRGVLLAKTPKGKDLLFLRGTKTRSPFASGPLGVGT